MVPKAGGSSKPVRIIVWITVIGVIGYFAASWLQREHHNSKFASVLFSGVHHMGPNFNVPDLYVDGYSRFNVQRTGSGGDICCVALPKKWRPGLTVDIRWAVGDWTKENRTDIEKGNYDSVSFKTYRAIVPIERYATAAHLYAHFFSNGRVRVISSTIGEAGKDHPITDDPRDANIATIGTPVNELFTTAEIAARREEAEEAKSGGSWK